jgi:anti-sigma factor ChrR (cupin superfamily)
MRINADFSKPAVVIADDHAWVHSPEAGVERLMLDRIGDEVARATSIVRYAPGSAFPTHGHAKGEEYFVLDGVFSDESGDYPCGTYVRNPPGSSHAPFSKGGCRIIVKLRQFDPGDLEYVVIDTADESRWQSGILELHSFGDERVRMARIGAGDSLAIDREGGLELLVVTGELSYGENTLGDEGWLRLPPGDSSPVCATQETLAWVKTGHLKSLL